MTEEHKNWIEANKLIFTTSRNLSPEELKMVFEIYNAITGENKKTTGCGRCITNTLRRVWFEYNRL